MTWIPNKTGTFTVKSFYMEMQKDLSMASGTYIRKSATKLWKGLVPYKVEVFIWLALHDKINTKKRLARLKILSMDEINCSFCNSWPEDTSHLFLQCPYSLEIWGWWWEIWGVRWVWPSSLERAYEQWSCSSSSKFFGKVWNAIFLVIVWSLWKERNNRIFNGKVMASNDLQNLILTRLCCSVDEVIRNPKCLHWKMEARNHSLRHPLRLASLHPGLKWIVGASSLLQNGVLGGYLIRGDNEILCLFSTPCPPMPFNSAVVSAIHRAIQISLNNEVLKSQPIKILSSSWQAQQWCSSSVGGPPNMSFILNSIRLVHKRGMAASFEFSQGCESFVDNTLSLKGVPRFSNVVVWL